MNTETFKHNPIIVELQKNPRLQWMLLLVLIILLASAIKTGIDGRNEEYAEVVRQQAMVARLVSAANRPLQAEQVDMATAAASSLLSSAPSAPGASIAEATALTEADKISNQFLIKGRSKLIGSDVIEAGSQTFWQIRIELTGQLPDKKVIDFLSLFDGANSFRRMPTFQLRTNASNTVTVVIDFLYKKEVS